MTTVVDKAHINDRHKRIYGAHGDAIASIPLARSEWEGALLAECERGHIYALPHDVTQWVLMETGCPRCRVLGHC